MITETRRDSNSIVSYSQTMGANPLQSQEKGSDYHSENQKAHLLRSEIEFEYLTRGIEREIEAIAAAVNTSPANVKTALTGIWQERSEKSEAGE